MLKKIILTLSLVGISGLLIWGGINRTLAKSGNIEGRNVESSANGKQHGNTERNLEDCEEDGLRANNLDEGNSQLGMNTANLNLVSADSSSYGATSQRRGIGGQGQINGNREPLDAPEIDALYLALDDEYHALAVYQSVIVTFGDIEPFVEIAASEQRHINALLNQFNKYNLPIPENPWMGQIPPFESVQQACQVGVVAEIENADLYDQLFSMTDDSALIRVFTNLRNASLNSHLPQFEACQ